MAWVVCDPAILPSPQGIEPTRNTEGQFLYVRNYKDQVSNWWTGILRVWEVTKLTDSSRRGALLELSHPLTPRVRLPDQFEIPMDSDDSDEDGIDTKMQTDQVPNVWKMD